jgi:hypothetical protein
MEIEECLYLRTESNLLLGVFCQSELVASRSCFIKKNQLNFRTSPSRQVQYAFWTAHVGEKEFHHLVGRSITDSPYHWSAAPCTPVAFPRQKKKKSYSHFGGVWFVAEPSLARISEPGSWWPGLCETMVVRLVACFCPAKLQMEVVWLVVR